jgi:hypothetical protein
MKPERAKRSVLIAGLAVPAGLLFTIALLTLVQWDFARSLGWHPWRAAMFDWPSGLALGPYGRALTVAFLVCAGALLLLAISRLVPSRAFAVSCVVVAVGMVGLAFDTDPTLARKPATWHGRLHDAGFITMGLGLLGVWVSSWPHVRRSFWLATLTVVSALSLLAVLATRGVAIYAFLLLTASWFVCVVAVRAGSMSDTVVQTHGDVNA